MVGKLLAYPFWKRLKWPGSAKHVMGRTCGGWDGQAAGCKGRAAGLYSRRAHNEQVGRVRTGWSSRSGSGGLVAGGEWVITRRIHTRTARFPRSQNRPLTLLGSGASDDTDVSYGGRGDERAGLATDKGDGWAAPAFLEVNGRVARVFLKGDGRAALAFLKGDGWAAPAFLKVDGWVARVFLKGDGRAALAFLKVDGWAAPVVLNVDARVGLAHVKGDIHGRLVVDSGNVRAGLAIVKDGGCVDLATVRDNGHVWFAFDKGDALPVTKAMCARALPLSEVMQAADM
ncbi:hypothetical protein GGX14DRAFT_393128 [Mycena pura]|uniref:Uncharacterized protein n=1 Tax=Mycena pura TaxID=153505 RepID=A0AAD6VHC2_9AGAR|nr:hypothetical protein GGX14DRAFT_393128 [Mycena pura]